MSELSDILPKNVIMEANDTIKMQESLMGITSSTINDCFLLIMGLPFIHSSEGIRNIANNILLAVQYRPFSLDYLVDVSVLLHGKIADDNCLSKLNSIFLDIPVKILDEKWKVAFLHAAYIKGLFKDDELFGAIKKYLDNTPIDKSKPFWKNNSRQHILFFTWFAPLFEKMDQNLYEESKQLLFASFEHHDLTANYAPYINNFEKLRENNWLEYEKMLNNFYGEGSIPDIIRHDDSEALKAALEEPDTKLTPDSRIESSFFEFVLFLGRKPTFAMYAAFCGSEKCFNLLCEKGANLKQLDFGKRTMLNFAIAGGNENIIKTVTSVINDFVVATRISAEYHRFELFRYFLKTKHANLKANDIENGSIFHGIAAANHIKMILFCLEQGCNVNLKDGDGVHIKDFTLDSS